MTIRDAIDRLDVLCVLDAPSLRTAVDMAKDTLREVEALGGLDRLRELVEADREGDILRRNTPMSIYPDDDSSVEACPTCGSGEYLYNDDGDICRYCGQCGQRLDWTNDFYDRICTRPEEENENA